MKRSQHALTHDGQRGAASIAIPENYSNRLKTDRLTLRAATENRRIPLEISYHIVYHIHIDT